MKKAIVLLSGGMDSTTALYWAKKKDYTCHCLIFDYGQRHKKEVKAAKKIAKKTGCSFNAIRIKLPWTGKNALIDRKVKIPHHKLKEIGRGPIPPTYVPGRNTLFVSYAISAADALGAEAIVIGANSLDFSGYPDCRPNYYHALQKVARLGTKRGIEGKPIKILAPLVRLNKAQIAKLGTKLGVPWKLTWSCYAGGKKPCGTCDACQLRTKGFREAELISI